jgi:hypothetical protein
MKKLYIIFMTMLLGACICPQQKVYMWTITPCGPIAMSLEEGALNTDEEGKTWFADQESCVEDMREKMDALIQELMKQKPGV